MYVIIPCPMHFPSHKPNSKGIFRNYYRRKYAFADHAGIKNIIELYMLMYPD